MMTFLNWVPPPQVSNAEIAMEVVVVGMVTFAQPAVQEEQAVQLQYTCPTTEQNIFESS
jgi:hypothetical protein